MRSRWLALGGLLVLLATAPALRVWARAGAPSSLVLALARRKTKTDPDLKRALRALQRAEGELEKATGEFGDHRARAEGLTEQALQEVQEALKSVSQAQKE